MFILRSHSHFALRQPAVNLFLSISRSLRPVETVRSGFMAKPGDQVPGQPVQLSEGAEQGYPFLAASERVWKMPAERERSPHAAGRTRLSRVLRPGTGRAPVSKQHFPNTLSEAFWLCTEGRLALGVPGFDHLQRAHEHLAQAESIGPVFRLDELKGSKGRARARVTDCKPEPNGVV